MVLAFGDKVSWAGKRLAVIDMRERDGNTEYECVWFDDNLSKMYSVWRRADEVTLITSQGVIEND
jgi:hypothetical protein